MQYSMLMLSGMGCEMTRYGGHGYCNKKPHPKRCDNGCKACSIKSQSLNEHQRGIRLLSDTAHIGSYKYQGGDFFCRKQDAWVQDNEYRRICTVGCGEYK